MAEQTVCAVMLTRDRPEMARRAVAAFRAQTYKNKRLFILDTGNEKAGYFLDAGEIEICRKALSLQCWSIGRLRNEAIDRADASDIIVHWDDDDWSHPNRIAEQVALLHSSGADAVGYREVLFWRQDYPESWDEDAEGQLLLEFHSAAWLYANPASSYAIGSSLCYWRSAWQKHPFEDLPKAKGGTGEDEEWRRHVRCVGVGSMCAPDKLLVHGQRGDPRMICSIHGGNTMPYEPEVHPEAYRRAPEFDAHCSAIMRI